MELRVQLKICEGCGCLWYRPFNLGTVYCCGCREKLEKFPNPETRKQAGRPVRRGRIDLWGVATAEGGAE